MIKLRRVEARLERCESDYDGCEEEVREIVAKMLSLNEPYYCELGRKQCKPSPIGKCIYNQLSDSPTICLCCKENTY